MRYFNKAMLVASAALCLNLSVFSQNITLKTGNVTVKEAMEQLKKSSGYSFVFSSVDVDTQKHISISVQDGNIDDVVRQILAGQIGITYEIKDKNIIIKKSENGVVSSKKLQTKGSVRDVNGEPIIGATVMERGTSNGTITDIDGNFMLEVPEGAMLDISYVGYKNQSVQVLSGKQIAISLREDSETLDEVVVIGYGAQKKVNVIGSIATLDQDALAQNAYLHMGLAGLQLKERNQARMAFEQASRMDFDRSIQEQALFNYALCIHETSYSPFAESVTVFERFLNEYPSSVYAEKVNDYLVEVYMNTRSYEVALRSIEKIAHPSARILEQS